MILFSVGFLPMSSVLGFCWGLRAKLKINVYLKEYVDEDYLKELEMAFKSVGQKYGFVSAGDVFRKKLADAEQKVTEAEDKLAQNKADTEAVLREIGLSEDKIVEVQTRLEALQQSRFVK